MAGNTNKHGNLCSCRMLSMAVTGEHNHCNFNYCRKILQMHWVMKCNHGEMDGLKDSPPDPVYEPVIFPDGSIEVVEKDLGQEDGKTKE